MENYCKYYKQKKQVSYDSGTTWNDVTPYEYQKGELYESFSTDCGYIANIKRWITSGTTCYNYDKYNKEIEQSSPDGINWTNTGNERLGSLIEYNSEDCGYTPTPLNGKLRLTYSDGSIYTIECDKYPEISQYDTERNYQKDFKDVSAITRAEVGDCVEVISNLTFSGCSSLTSITIPNSVISVGDAFLYGCVSLPITNSIRYADTCAVEAIDKTLTTYTLKNSTRFIGESAFQNCTNLTNITIPNGVIEIAANAFRNCSSLSSITIPSGVARIGYSAFNGCTNITGDIVFPSSLIHFNECVLSGCSGITSITFLSPFPPSTTLSEPGKGPLGGINCPVYVPCESLDLYKNSSDYWGLYSDRYRGLPMQYRWEKAPTTDYVCDSTTHTKYYKEYYQVTYDCGSTWQNVTPESSRTSSDVIEYNSYDCGYVGTRWVVMSGANDYWCDGTTKKAMEKEQTSTDGVNWTDTGNIRSGSTVLEYNSYDCGYAKFKATYSGGSTYSIACNSSSALTSGDTRPSGYDFSAMTSAEIGNCINSIGDSAFSRCYSLTSCTIGSGATSIGNSAFDGCTGLTSIVIPNSVTSIGNGAFTSCRSLTSVAIPNSVTSIGNRTFFNCFSLTSITIPDSVTSISNMNFYDCSAMTNCIIGDGVETIGEYAFCFCGNIRSMTIGSGVTSIGGNAFDRCGYYMTMRIKATTPPTLVSNAFTSSTNISTIYVPSASVNAYKSASGWSDYASRIQAIP